jgi:hypothetical protein
VTDLDGPDEVVVRLATELGLPLSRLIAQSKSGYIRRHPQHALIFNATIADSTGRRLWWGDLDLTIDESILVQLAERVGLDLYVYYEGDSRRGFVETIDPINAVFLVHPEGTVDPGTRSPFIFRSPFGRLIRRPARTPNGGAE